MANGNGKSPATRHPTRMAPHSVEAEESVLGSILLNPRALYEVSPFLAADDFFIVRNGWVWDAITRLDARGEEIDNITVAEELRQQARLDDVGGAAYITYLINHTPSSIYTETYGRIVQRAAIRRRMLDAASEIAKLAHEESEDIEQTLDAADASWLSATARQRTSSSKTVGAVTSSVTARFEERLRLRQQGIKVFGLHTGFHDLDRVLRGLQPGQLITIAGRPGTGKSSWMLTVALNLAREGTPVAMASHEMSVEEMTTRLISMDSGINSQRIDDADLTQDEIAQYYASEARIAALPIILDDEPNMGILSLKAKARGWVRDQGVKVIFDDYLQLMAGVGDNREQEISFIARHLKQLARELQVPVVVGAQLNRKVEERQDKRPHLSDIRESGSVEQDSDVVMFIYRDEMYNEDTERPNEADIIVAKHRNGPTGVISLFFRKELTLFASLTKTRVDFAEFNAGSDNGSGLNTNPPEVQRPAGHQWHEDLPEGF